MGCGVCGSEETETITAADTDRVVPFPGENAEDVKVLRCLDCGAEARLA